MSQLEKIFQAIREQKNPNGSSLVYLKKSLKAETTASKSQLMKTLKKAVEGGDLIQEKSSYRIPGEIFEPPPDERLEITDTVMGTGPPAASGDTVTMKYRGTLVDGTEFDKGDRFRFTIDAGEVIKGWDRGIKGMCKGGIRRLVIPPK